MAQTGNWTEERLSAQGTGREVVLGGVISPDKVPFLGSIAAGEVWYSIINGNNREAGIGLYDGAGGFNRQTVHAAFEGGVYRTDGIPISLAGSSVISCTFNTQAFLELTNSSIPDLSIRSVTADTVIQPSDNQNVIELNSATPVILTISSGFTPLGAQIIVTQIGAGQVEIQGEAGVSFRATDGLLKTRKQNSVITLYQRAADNWVVMGDRGI